MIKRRHSAVPGGVGTTWYRVWLVACARQPPRPTHDRVLDATAIKPAERGVLSASQATRYVEAFNRAALARGLGVWALAVPVAVRYEGDLQSGERVVATAIGVSVSSELRRCAAREGWPLQAPPRATRRNAADAAKRRKVRKREGTP